MTQYLSYKELTHIGILISALHILPAILLETYMLQSFGFLAELSINVSLGHFWLWQFFSSRPLACEPAELPKYPPSKEMDARVQDEETRRYMLNTLFISVP